MRFVPYVAFDHLAVEIFAVGAVERCVEVLVHAHERFAAHTMLPVWHLWVYLSACFRVRFVVNRHQIRERDLRVFLRGGEPRVA
jgi:hypothetical protein